MRRQIQAGDFRSKEHSNLSTSAVDAVPDIDNRVLSLDEVLSWLDRLVEVSENEENASS